MTRKRKWGRLLGSSVCALRPSFHSSAGKIMLNIERGMLMVKLNGDVNHYYVRGLSAAFFLKRFLRLRIGF